MCRANIKLWKISAGVLFSAVGASTFSRTAHAELQAFTYTVPAGGVVVPDTDYFLTDPTAVLTTFHVTPGARVVSIQYSDDTSVTTGEAWGADVMIDVRAFSTRYGADATAIGGFKYRSGIDVAGAGPYPYTIFYPGTFSTPDVPGFTYNNFIPNGGLHGISSPYSIYVPASGNLDLMAFTSYVGGHWGSPPIANVVNSGTFTVTIDTSDPFMPTPAPTAAPIGVLSSTTVAIDSGQVRWFSFIYAGGDLRIDTLGTALSSYEAADTDIAVYDDVGVLVATNDDADLANGVYSSELNFANGALPAGTYYLAVTGWDGIFTHDFNAATTSTATGTLTVNLTGTAVPEPSALAFLGMAGLALIHQRRA